MPDLTTTYLGLRLRTPVVAGACTHTASVAGARKLAEQGVGAIVLKSIFEEQIRADIVESETTLEAETGMHAEVYDYLRAGLPMQLGPKAYLERIGEIKAAVDIPVIASLNCLQADRWLSYARQIAASGADALELNIYDIADWDAVDGQALEDRHVELATAVCRQVNIPVAVKLSPYYTALGDVAGRFDAVPVQGLVLFNRFLQPDIDISRQALASGINLSRPEDIRLPLRWTALLSTQVKADIALSGGVHDADGVIKALLAGAASVQVCSVLYRQGLDCVAGMIRGLADWMGASGYDRVDAFRGRLCRTPTDRGGFERAQYVRALTGLE